MTAVGSRLLTLLGNDYRGSWAALRSLITFLRLETYLRVGLNNGELGVRCGEIPMVALVGTNRFADPKAAKGDGVIVSMSPDNSVSWSE